MSQQPVWMQNSIYGIACAAVENDVDGCLVWLDFMAERVLGYIEGNLINGPDKERHLSHVLIPFSDVCDSFADFSVLIELGALRRIAAARKRAAGFYPVSRKTY